jgi:hypothetical protein
MLPVGQIGASGLELELAHSQGQKGLKLSQVGNMHVADIQVVDMSVEKMLAEDMLAFPVTFQEDIAWHIPFQTGELSASQALLELLADIVR